MTKNNRVPGRPYEECPVCKAHLDCGEECDCERRERDEKSCEDRVGEGRTGRNKDDHPDAGA